MGIALGVQGGAKTASIAATREKVQFAPAYVGDRYL